ncbi:hypothetical protein T01_5491 [Trichinella spiralis]|uniref:Uncharacterized protein n=1 Tax=Trichinella spiralis TaxID=6334 RepID=A0A0V1BFJ5_TRISP|nr:hypothetical protein T01_5491 [Trichinella spiralis]
MNRKADVVVQQQNKRRFQRKPDKQHDLYSVWSITLCNSSKNVSPNDGTINVTAQLHLRNSEHCRWHSATCTLRHSNPETKNMMKPRTSIGKLTALRLLYSSSMTELLTAYSFFL